LDKKTLIKYTKKRTIGKEYNNNSPDRRVKNGEKETMSKHEKNNKLIKEILFTITESFMMYRNEDTHLVIMLT